MLQENDLIKRLDAWMANFPEPKPLVILAQVPVSRETKKKEKRVNLKLPMPVAEELAAELQTRKSEGRSITKNAFIVEAIEAALRRGGKARS